MSEHDSEQDQQETVENPSESGHQATEDGVTYGQDIPDASAGGDTMSTPDVSQPDLTESEDTAPEDEVTPQGGEGEVSEDSSEQVATEREVIVGEQGLGSPAAADHVAHNPGSGFNPDLPVATSAAPAQAQSGVPNLAENEGVEPGEDQPAVPGRDE